MKKIGGVERKHIYEGEFFNNKKHGQGRYDWPDGRYYEGL